jgi:hypothetical protein
MRTRLGFYFSGHFAVGKVQAELLKSVLAAKANARPADTQKQVMREIGRERLHFLTSILTGRKLRERQDLRRKHGNVVQCVFRYASENRVFF